MVKHLNKLLIWRLNIVFSGCLCITSFLFKVTNLCLYMNVDNVQQCNHANNYNLVLHSNTTPWTGHSHIVQQEICQIKIYKTLKNNFFFLKKTPIIQQLCKYFRNIYIFFFSIFLYYFKIEIIFTHLHVKWHYLQ